MSSRLGFYYFYFTPLIREFMPWHYWLRVFPCCMLSNWLPGLWLNVIQWASFTVLYTVNCWACYISRICQYIAQGLGLSFPLFTPHLRIFLLRVFSILPNPLLTTGLCLRTAYMAELIPLLHLWHTVHYWACYVSWIANTTHFPACLVCVFECVFAVVSCRFSIPEIQLSLMFFKWAGVFFLSL